MRALFAGIKRKAQRVFQISKVNFGKIVSRKGLKKKPLRSPQRPVKIVFFCLSGGSSKAAAKMFTERMAKNGINYINVSAIELENLNTHALVDIETLKQKLSEMDIVLQPFHEGSSLEQLIRNATPKTAVYEKITDWLGTIDRDLLELVHKNFKTRNSD